MTKPELEGNSQEVIGNYERIVKGQLLVVSVITLSARCVSLTAGLYTLRASSNCDSSERPKRFADGR